MNVYAQLKALQIALPQKPPPGGIYDPAKEFGDRLVYLSGMGSDIEPGEKIKGRLGLEISLEQGQRAARNCILNALANLDGHLGDLNRIKRFVKVLAFVASGDGFYQQPQVVNGGSQLLVDLFGVEVGRPARSAIGVNVLPGNIPVEIEMLIELK